MKETRGEYQKNSHKLNLGSKDAKMEKDKLRNMYF